VSWSLFKSGGKARVVAELETPDPNDAVKEFAAVKAVALELTKAAPDGCFVVVEANGHVDFAGPATSTAGRVSPAGQLDLRVRVYRP